MYDFNQDYITECNRTSDINEHLPTLDRLAKDCKHITEFGVRDGVSTTVWLNNDVEIVSYDLYPTPRANFIFSQANTAGKPAQYIIGDIRALKDIEETDLLFVDSHHIYEQCSFELTNFGNKARKYIVFHDTVLFGRRGEHHGDELLLAIAEFLVSNTHWTVKEHYTNNNGLTVLERKIPSIIG